MRITVLVTGGFGFIGSWVLRELLVRGYRAIVIDTQKSGQRWQRILGRQAIDVAWINADLIDPNAVQNVLDEHNVTHVIHLAAVLTPQCQQDPWRGCQVNVLGSTSVFEAARRSGRVKSISYASSFAVYGPETVEHLSEPNRPPMFYGAFKQAVDLIAEQYWRHFEIASVAIRPHVVYGPERDQGLTAGPSLACKAAALGMAYEIGFHGLVGYDYVEDVARAFVRGAIECPRGATVVDLPGEQATSEKFLQTIIEVVPSAIDLLHISGPSIPANIPPQPNYISNLFPDWQTTTLKDGVQRTIDFYR